MSKREIDTSDLDLNEEELESRYVPLKDRKRKLVCMFLNRLLEFLN